jgi:GNAT superfamily N-acetyltransferase
VNTAALALGTPVDTNTNVLNLQQAATGALMGAAHAFAPSKLPEGEKLSDDKRAGVTPKGLYHYIDANGQEVYSKNPAPEGARPYMHSGSIADSLPQFIDPATQVGGSEWLKEQARHLLGSDLVDVREKTKLNQYIQAGGVGAAMAATGNEGSLPRALAAGASAGVAQQGAADAGFSPGAQAVIGFLAGHAAGTVGAGKGAKGAVEPTVEPEAPPPTEYPEKLLATPDTALDEQGAAKPPVQPVAEPPAAKTAPAASETAPKAAPSAETPAIAHEVDSTGEHTYKTQDGKGALTAQETDIPSGPAVQIKRSDVEAEARGKGIGTALYQKAADDALAAGKRLVSDVSVSPAAAEVYSKLRKAGYGVIRNPSDVNLDTDNLVSRDPRTPVFEVTSAPKAEATAPEPVVAPPTPPRTPPASLFGGAAQEGKTQAAATPADKQARVDTFRRIGLNETRGSAITGDTRQAGTEYQTSLLKNPAGNRLAEVIDNEQNAVREHAQGLITASGGSEGLAQPDVYARGNVMAAPVDAYHEHLEQAMQAVYAAATERARGLPIQHPALQELMTKNRAQFLGTVEGKQLLEGVTERMKELGLFRGEGNDTTTFNPATVEQSERLRQFLNDQWSPRTARLIGQLRSALDDDVAKAAGDDIYRDARAIRTLQAKTLEEPKGVSKLLLPTQANRLGINRSVDAEAVPSYITKLPYDQFRQYISVLKQASTASPELKAQAVNALNETRAQFANEYFAAGNSTKGMWNPKAANAYLRKNEANMRYVYSPEEMSRFLDNDNAGRWLSMDRRYPGAAVQGHNLAVTGALKAADMAGTVVGAHAGGIAGAAAGHMLGKGAAKLADKAQQNNAEKLVTDLNTWKP